MTLETAPIRPEKALFSRKDFCPIFSENLGLKPAFVSPHLDFPQSQVPDSFSENSQTPLSLVWFSRATSGFDFGA